MAAQLGLGLQVHPVILKSCTLVVFNENTVLVLDFGCWRGPTVVCVTSARQNAAAATPGPGMVAAVGDFSPVVVVAVPCSQLIAL